MRGPTAEMRDLRGLGLLARKLKSEENHRTGEIVHLELGEMRSPGCEHSQSAPGYPGVNIYCE
eukprot:6487179-Prymnesium_polylepis.1